MPFSGPIQNRRDPGTRFPGSSTEILDVLISPRELKDLTGGGFQRTIDLGCLSWLDAILREGKTPPMKMQTKKSGPNLLVSLAGELLGEAAAEVQKAVREHVGAPEQGANVVWIDLSGLDHVDSIGLGMFMGLKSTCGRTGAKLRFVGPSENILTTLVAVRFTQVMDIVTRKQAQSQAPDLF